MKIKRRRWKRYVAGLEKCAMTIRFPLSTLATFLKALTRGSKNRRNMMRLDQLSDAQLADIGLTRDCLRRAKGKRFSADPTRYLSEEAHRHSEECHVNQPRSAFARNWRGSGDKAEETTSNSEVAVQSVRPTSSSPKLAA